MTILKSLLIWLLFIPCAILNGGLREYVLTPSIGEQMALPLSGLLLCVLIFAVTWFLLPKIGRQKKATFTRIGVVWLILIILFETLLGLSSGSSFKELLYAYDITSGNLWLMVVLFTGFVPYCVVRQRKLFNE